MKNHEKPASGHESVNHPSQSSDWNWITRGLVQKPMPATVPIGFRGSASQYFELYVTNTLLTIITLGIYSPWARVRTYHHVAERLQLRLGPRSATSHSMAGDDLTALAGEFADVTGWDFDFGAI